MDIAQKIEALTQTQERLIQENKELLEESKKLKLRVEDLELYNDNGVLSAMICSLPKRSKVSLFAAVERGVATYFGIDTKVFFDKLTVGNKEGRRGRQLPENPDDILNVEDRIAVARFVLYAILHIDFCVPIPDLSDWYNTRVKDYIREWKVRYIRIFHSSINAQSPHDSSYKEYWLGAHAAIIEECQACGLYDELIDSLIRFEDDENISDIYLKKWRIDIAKR